VSVTKFLSYHNDKLHQDFHVPRFHNGLFLDASNDTSVTKFLEGDDTVVSKDNVNMTVIQFLEDVLYSVSEP